jgi:hypothetical protein
MQPEEMTTTHAAKRTWKNRPRQDARLELRLPAAMTSLRDARAPSAISRIDENERRTLWPSAMRAKIRLKPSVSRVALNAGQIPGFRVEAVELALPTIWIGTWSSTITSVLLPSPGSCVMTARLFSPGAAE